MLALLCVLWGRAAVGLQASSHAPRQSAPRTRLRACPEDCPPKVWAQVVEAEAASREKKFGMMGAALAGFGLDKSAIEENQLRIWEELKARAEANPAKKSGKRSLKSGDAPAAAEVAAPAVPGMFSNLKAAWDTMYKEADGLAYAQALKLNSDLEGKGLLPKTGPGDAAKPAPPPPPPAGGKKPKKKKSRVNSSDRGFG